MCEQDCDCGECVFLGYTPVVSNLISTTIIWEGLSIFNINNACYSVVQARLSYEGINEINFNSKITQIKFYIDKDLALPLLKVSRAHDQKPTVIFFNRN
jgi:hypothetical protein